jgi:hypothetical protein
MEPDEEQFTCAYPHCAEVVTKFAFVDANGNKYCSPFCRRKAEEARREALEADPEDTIPRSSG